MKRKNTNLGFSLVELLLAVTLVGVITPNVFFGIRAPLLHQNQQELHEQAITYLEKYKEGVKSIAKSNWASIATNGTYYLSNPSGSTWSLSAGSETSGGITRSLTIASVSRDVVSGNIVTSGGTIDPNTKKVTYVSSWSQPLAISETFTEYITRNAVSMSKIYTTQSDFAAGTLTNTSATSTNGGRVELLPTLVDNTYVEPYTSSGSYTFDSAKIEFASGIARLKNLGGGGGPSGATVNSACDSAGGNWTYAEWSDVTSQSGAYMPTGGNPNSFLRGIFQAERNKTAGLYWHQPFTVAGAGSAGTLSLQWRVPAYVGSPNPDTFKLYAFVDTGSSAPTLAQAVWSSSEVTSTTSWSGTVNVDVSSKITTAGTYYLKIAAYIDYNNGQTRGPFEIGFDNVSLTWGSAAPSYASDSPTVINTTQFTNPLLYSWQTFAAVESPNGGSVRYQLSDDNGATWKYWNGSSWVAATLATHYNDATVINANIPTFPAASKALKIKVFLIGNGSQQVGIDSVTVGYKSLSPSGSSGSYISPIFDATANAGFHRVQWTNTAPSGSYVRLKVATNSDGTTWNYVGPDGTGATYYTSPGGVIPLSNTSGRYARFQIDLYSPDFNMPVVDDVFINYSL